MATRITTIFPALAMLSLAAGTASAEGVGDAQQGKLVYQRYCISCHGEKGNGQGEFADWITPKPRDYRQGTFKWRSTPSGSLPTDADLERVLINGLYGTYMPSWNAIGHHQRLNVIAYIKTFAPRFAAEKPQAPISIPPEPRYTSQSVARGAAPYKKFNSAQCYGVSAQAAGPSAHKLNND